jgi:hypothetical protein
MIRVANERQVENMRILGVGMSRGRICRTMYVSQLGIGHHSSVFDQYVRSLGHCARTQPWPAIKQVAVICMRTALVLRWIGML